MIRAGEPSQAVTVRCQNWQQVEDFCDQKLGLGELISVKARDYFQPGHTVTVGLELPNEMVIAFDTRVVDAVKTSAGATLSLTLIGSNRPVVRRLRNLLDDASEMRAFTSRTKTEDGLRAITGRARTSEVVSEEHERSIYLTLEDQLKQMRNAPMAQLFGVDNPEAAYVKLVSKYHPANYSALRSTTITKAAEELLTIINSAYAKLMMDGQELTLLTSPSKTRKVSSIDDLFAVQPDTSTPDESVFLNELDNLIAQGKFSQAIKAAARAIHSYPKANKLRARYHFASGKLAFADGKTVVAISQFEAAITYDRDYEEAQTAIDRMRTIRRRS